MTNGPCTPYHAAWGDMLYGYVVTVVASSQLADELYSEVLERVVIKQELIRAASNPQGYALRLAANFVRDHQRHETRIKKKHTSDTGLALVAAENDDDTIDADTVGAINDALLLLPLAQREVLSLKLWQNKTFQEIAEILDISANTAASRYRYALQKLQTSLQELRDEQ